MELTMKQRIARAAFAKFIEQGYQNTTIREIAAQCGISHVNVLRHYKSKGELALELVTTYINLLMSGTKYQAVQLGLQPSEQYSDLYWLSHYCFLARNPAFARFYHEVYECSRDEFHLYLTRLSGRGHVTSEELMGYTMQISEAEAELYSKLIVDADMHMVQMQLDEKATPIWSVQSMNKLIRMLFLRHSEEQIHVEEVLRSSKALEQSIECVVGLLEVTLLQNNL